LLIAQTKVINETFLKLFAVKAQPYLKKPWVNAESRGPNGIVQNSVKYTEIATMTLSKQSNLSITQSMIIFVYN
jgi:hypothetical protein